MRPKNKKFYLGSSPLSLNSKLTSYKYYIKGKQNKEKNYKYIKITTITNNATTNKKLRWRCGGGSVKEGNDFGNV